MGSIELDMSAKAAAHILRRMGARFEGFGLGLQGELAFIETMGTHRAVSAYQGNVNSITVGSNSHIGDRTVVHVASEAGSVKGKALNTSIGDGVSIGPLSVIHACTVANGAAIGGCSKLLDGCVVEAGAIVESGSLVSPGMTVPAGEVWGGVPAKHLRNATAEDVAATAAQLEDAATLSRVHHAECSKSWSQVHDEKIDVHEGQFKDPDYTSDWKGEWRA